MKDYLNAVVGNKELRMRLGNDILADRLPHALILEGPCGTGKHTIAKMCAAALICEKKGDAEEPLPCLSCLACRKVLENKSPDVIYLSSGDKVSIGVDAVRFLKEDVTVVPNDSEHKIYIIEGADKMTPQAQNALLLTLEEPPHYVHFFLLCESSELLLETIKSRAPILRTELIAKEDVDKYICSVDRRAAQMKLSDPRGYNELLTASGLGIGRALEYLEPRRFAPIKQMRSFAEDFVSCAIKNRGASEIISFISKFSTKREIVSEQLSLISLAIRDLLILKKSDTASLLFFSDEDKAAELSDRASITFLYDLNQAISIANDEIGRNANVKLCLTKMALNAKLL